MERQENVAEAESGARRYRSPNRILARSFRMSRDNWKEKHHAVQDKLEQARQLAAERGTARDRWRDQCDAALARVAAAEALAAHRLNELEQVHVRLAELERAGSKKTR